MTMRTQLLTLSAASFHRSAVMKLLRTKKVPNRNVSSRGTSPRKTALSSLEVQETRETVQPPRKSQVDRQRGSESPGDHDRDEDQLEVVLGLDGPDEAGLARQVRRGDEELLADERVVARDDEERQLVDVGCPRDLDRARAETRLRHQERLRVEGSHEEARGRQRAGGPA